VVTLTKRHLLAQCSYDGLFKSICQALCLYRKEADNRQDYYEELHEDRESVALTTGPDYPLASKTSPRKGTPRGLKRASL
jgi:hypothetical protein